MRSVGKRVTIVVVGIVVVLGAFVWMAATVLPDNPVKQLFKQQEALSTAKMHMSQVKNGVYSGFLRFADDIDFNNLSLSQMIPVYGTRQNGEFFRYENDVYAVYSGERVVALFGIYKGETYSGTSMTNIGLDTVQSQLSNPGTCANIVPYGYSCDVYATSHSGEVVRIPWRSDPSQGIPAPETVAMETVGITPEMIAQIDFPEHQDPIPFSV